MEIQKEFVKRLREITRGMSQKEIAGIAECSEVTMSRYLNETAKPTIEVLAKLSDHFKVTIEWLIGMSDNKTPDNVVKSTADMIRMIEKICDTTTCGSAWQATLKISPQDSNISIEIHNEALNQFLRERDDMKRLLENGTIKQSLYDLWYDDQLKKYEKFDLSGNDYSDLPFDF